MTSPPRPVPAGRLRRRDPRRTGLGRLLRTGPLASAALLAGAASAVTVAPLHAQDRPNQVGTLGAPGSEDVLPGDPTEPADLEGTLLAPDDATADLVPDGRSSLIDDVRARQGITAQVLEQRVAGLIRDTRAVRATDPEVAVNELKDLLTVVAASTDVPPEVRRGLERRLRSELTAATGLLEKARQDLIVRQIAASEAEAQEALLDVMRTEEEELENLIDQVRAAINDGIHGESEAYERAEFVARRAVSLRPGNGPATAALFTSEAAGQLDKAFRIRSLRNDRFLETLYQVELSHVPFPDEPPVRFPNPAVWEALSRSRIQRYSSVSLESNSPAERAVNAALEQPAVVADYFEQPLRDVLDELASRHDITIVPDKAALEADGISLEDSLVTIPKLEGIKLRSILKLILEPAELTYIIENEVLTITTLTKAEDELFIRVYPVADLVITIPNATGGGGGLGGGGLGGGGGGLGGGGGGLGGGGQGGGGFGGGGGAFSVPPEDVGKKKPTR